jgi:large subunit ribosomal protein L2
MLNLLSFYKIFKNPLVKKNLIGLKNSSGRNSFGRITIKHRGSGHKKKLRVLSFNRMFNSVGIIISIEYDPNRNTYISCVYDTTEKKYFYIILPKNSKIGDIVRSGTFAELSLGDNLKIIKIPIGSYIHNVSINPDNKGIICRSAGTFAIIMEKNNKYATVRLSSGEKKSFSLNCTATLGTVSNEQYLLNNIGKAGRARWLNRRPKVRGVAMNPVDHPHGGGEGKKSGNKILLTPWGKPTKNKKTRKIKS